MASSAISVLGLANGIARQAATIAIHDLVRGTRCAPAMIKAFTQLRVTINEEGLRFASGIVETDRTEIHGSARDLLALADAINETCGHLREAAQ